jgi:hypothetical protein
MKFDILLQREITDRHILGEQHKAAVWMRVASVIDNCEEEINFFNNPQS